MTRVFSLVLIQHANDVKQIQLQPGEFSRSIILVQPGDAVAVRPGWGDPDPARRSRYFKALVS